MARCECWRDPILRHVTTTNCCVTLKTTPPTKPKSINRKFIVVTCAIVLALIGVFVVMLIQFTPRNHAQEVASPFVSELVSNGAVKKCEYSANGHGPDNETPWWDAYFELQAGKDEAIRLINKVASDNGYKLTHATPQNPGFLRGIADQYIESWYFDETSKDSPYADLIPGKVLMYMNVNASGADKACATPIKVDVTHSVIGVRVSLPNVKR